MGADLRLLGDIGVVVDERSVDIGHARQRSVLAVLLIEPNRVIPVDQLLDRVWADRPPQRAHAALSGYVSRLRQVLQPVAGVDLARRSGGYLLTVDPLSVDLHRFRHLVGRAKAAPDGAAAGILAQALGLWRGDAVATLDTPWLNAVRDGLHAERLAAELDHNDLALAAGRHGDLLPALAARIAAHPLDERLAGQYLLALYRAGRQAEALGHYELLRRRLAEDLGVDPRPALQVLHKQILTADPALNQRAIARGEAGAAEPGSDAVAEPPAAAPAAAEGMTVPAQLPAAVASFTGRARHLATLDALLDQVTAGSLGTVVISALAGMAGIGKTAMAVHWAHRVRERFPDGQLYVNLRGWAAGSPVRPIEALAGFLGGLGVPAEQIPIEVEQSAALYRSLLTGKRMLVVLDNARDATQVRPLLPGSPSCLVLVTSRDRLAGLVAVDGARLLALDVLSPEEANELLVRLLGRERMAAEPHAATELARLCAYLPLALRIAAANLTVEPWRSIAGLVTKLGERDRLTGLAVGEDQQAAVRTAFGHSYATLAPAARRLFRLLGLIPGPDITAEAAAALSETTPADAAGLLERLADAHLLGQHAAGRFAFHDLLRAYAAEQAQAEDGADEREAAISRLLDWYLHTTDAAAQACFPERLRMPLPPPVARPFTGFDVPARALGWLDAERANLVAAAQHAATTGRRPTAWLLANALRRYFWARMHTVDWLSIAHAGLAAAEAEGDLNGLAAAHLSLGNLHQRQGQDEQAIKHAARAVALCQRSGWLDGLSSALNNLGIVYLDLGHLHQAAEHLTHALAVNRETRSVAGQAVRHTNLGTVMLELGRLHEAVDHHTRALALSRRIGARASQCVELANLGGALHALGRLDEALDRLSRAAPLSREVGDRAAEADILRMLAEVHRDAGRHAQALDVARAAVAVTREIGDRKYGADALVTLATVLHRLGRLDRARTQAEEALALSRAAGYRLCEGTALCTLARIELDLDLPERARQHAQQSLDLHRETGQRLGEARALCTLGRVLLADGDHELAQCYVSEALALFTECGSPEADQSPLQPCGPASQIQ